MDKLLDVIIIGAGPAGLSAAIYAQRAMLKTVIIEKAIMGGGQIINTYEVDNYPGLANINGFDLAQQFREHAQKLNAQFVDGQVVNIVNKKEYKEIYLKDGQVIYTKTVIIAGGAHHRSLNIDGEKKFLGKGISYCATCDGAFYRNKNVAVIGGGDVALEDAIFLSRIASKVYLIHRRDEFRGAKVLSEEVKRKENIQIVFNSVVEDILGDESVSKISIRNTMNDKASEINVDGVFIAVGIEPDSIPFRDIVDVDENGYIIANENGITSVSGIFAAGDIRTKQLRQVVTAVADGANCIYSVEKYLTSEV